MEGQHCTEVCSEYKCNTFFLDMGGGKNEKSYVLLIGVSLQT